MVHIEKKTCVAWLWPSTGALSCVGATRALKPSQSVEKKHPHTSPTRSFPLLLLFESSRSFFPRASRGAQTSMSTKMRLLEEGAPLVTGDVRASSQEQQVRRGISRRRFHTSKPPSCTSAFLCWYSIPPQKKKKNSLSTGDGGKGWGGTLVSRRRHKERACGNRGGVLSSIRSRGRDERALLGGMVASCPLPPHSHSTLYFNFSSSRDFNTRTVPPSPSPPSSLRQENVSTSCATAAAAAAAETFVVVDSGGGVRPRSRRRRGHLGNTGGGRREERLPGRCAWNGGGRRLWERAVMCTGTLVIVTRWLWLRRRRL